MVKDPIFRETNERGNHLKVYFCLLVVSLVTLAACTRETPSQSDDQDPAPITIPPIDNGLKYASSVDPSQKAALDEAISSLHLLDLGTSDQELMKMMKLNDLKPATMQRWVEDRVQYIVDSEFDTDAATFAADKPGFSFPEPNLVPDSNKDSGGNDDSHEVVMLNIGSTVYVDGKRESQLRGVRVPGIGDVIMTSPRIGLLQIGPGLFPDGNISSGNIAIDIFRASVLFHEARHSDGNGKSAGFLHAACPSGHDYAGKYACDFASNGPYTIGAMVMKNLKEKCTMCTTRQHAGLDLVYADQANRVLNGFVFIPTHSPAAFETHPKDWDDTPEGSR